MNDLQTLELPKKSVNGIGLVILTHVLIIWGLASGLATHFAKKEQLPVTLIERPEPNKPVEPPEPVIPKPVFSTVTPNRIPEREVVIEQPQTQPTVAAVSNDLPSGGEKRPADGGQATTDGGAKPLAHVPPGPLRAEAVCDVMTMPEMPAVNWSGQASLKVQARLQAGRVAEVQFLSLTGGLDARTRRALQNAVQSALASYQCRGNQAFEQEFVFNIQ